MTSALAKSLQTKYRIQRIGLVLQLSVCVAALAHWAARSDAIDGFGTAVFAFVITLLASWRMARPYANAVDEIDSSSDPLAIARTCLSVGVDEAVKSDLALQAPSKVRFKSVPQITALTALAVGLAITLQWRSYAPQSISVIQQAALSAEMLLLGADGAAKTPLSKSELLRKQNAIEKTAAQLAVASRQYPRADAQAPYAKTILGGAEYGDEILVLQRYQELINKR
jgi:hypothetical protein